MKKTLALGISLCLLLCSCTGGNGGKEQSQTETQREELSIQELPPSYQIALDAAEQKAEYYRQLVEALQKEILGMQAQIGETTAEYESCIALLQAALKELDPTADPRFTYEIENGGAILTAYLGREEELELPATLGGVPLRKIADRAFENKSTLRSVVLPEGVRTLGWFAFAGCVSLGEITLPDTLEEISYGAFENHGGELTFLCSENSYAARYAASYGIPTKTAQ